ncbi:hypothetical protein ACFVXQ_13200 [Kitasatospora sp. NPDC058263]
MSAEIGQLVEQAGPYLAAALSTYGTTVLHRAEDAAADATANLGRRLLQTVWQRRSGTGQAALEDAVHEAAGDTEDMDAAAALRQQVKRALREDDELRAELAGLLASSAAPAPSIGSLKQSANVRDHGVVFQQGTGTQSYGPK